MAKIKVKTGLRRRLEDIVPTADIEKNVDKKTDSQEGDEKPKYSKTREVMSLSDADKTPRSGSTILMDIPIVCISDRKINKFIMSDIEQLAENIEINGLLQNIIVVEDKPENENDALTYTVVVGHRRLAAYRLLNKKYEGKKFTHISANVINKEKVVEKNAYLDSNGQTRKLSTFEVIANLDPEYMDFKDETFKNKYVEFMYEGNDEVLKEFKETGKIKGDNFDTISLGNYCSKLVEKVYPSFDCAPNTARKYVTFYNAASPELLEAIYHNKILIRDAFSFASLSKENQAQLLNSEDPMAELIKLKNTKKAKGAKSKKGDSANNDKAFGSVINKINKHIDSVVLLCKDAGKLAGDDKKRIKELTALNEAVEKFRKNIK